MNKNFLEALDNNYEVEDFSGYLGALLDDKASNEDKKNGMRFITDLYDLAVDNLNCKNISVEKANQFLQDHKINELSGTFLPSDFGSKLIVESTRFDFYFIVNREEYRQLRESLYILYNFEISYLGENKYPKIIGFEQGTKNVIEYDLCMHSTLNNFIKMTNNYLERLSDDDSE